jgi:uncharacterized membrane protein YecN with MAPEG domain
MGSVHPFLFYDFARERQRELLAEADQASLVKAARSGSNQAQLRPTLLLSVVLVWVMGAAAWTLLS